MARELMWKGNFYDADDAKSWPKDLVAARKGAEDSVSKSSSEKATKPKATKTEESLPANIPFKAKLEAAKFKNLEAVTSASAEELQDALSTDEALELKTWIKENA